LEGPNFNAARDPGKFFFKKKSNKRANHKGAWEPFNCDGAAVGKP
jgi:hypothetical protein